MHKYKIGDLIIYGGTGACKIKDIVEREFIDTSRKCLYYVIKPLYHNAIISVPVGTNKVFMRPLISKKEAERIIATIPTIEAKVFHSRIVRELSDHYEAAFKNHDCFDLVKLTMSIYAKKKIAQEQNKKIGAIDEKFMKRAEDLLFGELAASLGIPKDQVPEYIADSIEKKASKTAPIGALGLTFS